MSNKRIFIFFICCFFATHLYSQTASEKLERAVKLKKELKFAESFALFKELLKSDSTNLDYLANTAFLYAKLGYSQATESQKISFYKKAEYLSKKAIALNPTNGQSHFVYAYSLGRLNENVPSKQKIANAKLIKSECDKALELNPKLGGCHHILGRWHRTIAGFSALEKLAINTLYGGVPQGGSYDAAIEEFQKALQLEPYYILHYYELAVSYYERGNNGDDIFAKVWAQKALTLAPNLFDADEPGIRKKCKVLLDKLK